MTVLLALMEGGHRTPAAGSLNTRIQLAHQCSSSNCLEFEQTTSEADAFQTVGLGRHRWIDDWLGLADDDD
jgi:hypothetical protein